MKAKIISVDVTLYKDKVWLSLELRDENGWNFMQYFNSIYDVMNFFEVKNIKKLIGVEVETIDRNTWLTPFGFKNDKRVLLNDNDKR